MMKLQELRGQFPAAPEYLAQILLIERDGGIVPNARLATRLGVSRPAVTQAVGRLKKLGLVSQNRYEAIGLTKDGRFVAENIIRRHFLLEHLLVKALGYPWDKSDVEAATLQASLSEELTEYLTQRLGNPETCPHGNPMPNSSIEAEYLAAPNLSDASIDTQMTIIRITEEGELTPGMLAFCQDNKLEPGVVLTVVKHSLDESVCRLDDREISIPRIYADNIRWKALA